MVSEKGFGSSSAQTGGDLLDIVEGSYAKKRRLEEPGNSWSSWRTALLIPTSPDPQIRPQGPLCRAQAV